MVNTLDLLIYGMLAALLALGIWLLIATSLGWPVSTTHLLGGADIRHRPIHFNNAYISRCGIVRGIGALNMNVVRMIFMSWIITLPADGIFAIIFYSIIKAALEALK